MPARPAVNPVPQVTEAWDTAQAGGRADGCPHLRWVPVSQVGASIPGVLQLQGYLKLRWMP